MRHHARGFKDGDASASVVVRSWRFVIEMAAVDNFCRSGVGAGYCAGHNRPVAGADSCLRVGIQYDGFAASRARPQRLRGLVRHHECEAGRLTRIQMTPPNHSRIQARPCRGLVRHVADDAHGTMLRDCEFLHSRQNAIGEYDLAAHVLPGVIAFARAVADVDQFPFHVGTVTVVCEVNWICLPISEKNMLGPDFPEPSLFDRPRQVRAHEAVIPGSIDRELLAVSIGQAVLSRALQNELCGLIKFWSCRHSMQPSKVAQVLVRSSAARLVSQRRPLTDAEERLLTKSTERSECDKEADQAAHKLTRIALTLRLANLQHKTNCHLE